MIHAYPLDVRAFDTTQGLQIVYWMAARSGGTSFYVPGATLEKIDAGETREAIKSGLVAAGALSGASYVVSYQEGASRGMMGDRLPITLAPLIGMP